MTAFLDTPNAQLAELTAQDIELQAHGDRLRFRARKEMTPELVAGIATHMLGLLALLTITKTPVVASVNGGFGCGDVGDARDAIECIKRVLSGAELAGIRKADTHPHEGDEMSLLLSKCCATLLSMADLLNMMRKAIESSGQSRYRISQETGIAQSVLSRFMSGETALSVETVERLAENLGLEIMVRPKKRGARKGR